MNGKVNVLLVDENGFERRALRGFLEDQGNAHVLAEAEDVDEALAALKHSPPDVVIVCLPYDLEAGLSLVRTIQAMHRQTPVMVIASHREPLFAEQAISAGAAAYMLLHEVVDSLPQAVRCLSLGERYVGGHVLHPA